jgi:hypothetical protein
MILNKRCNSITKKFLHSHFNGSKSLKYFFIGTIDTNPSLEQTIVGTIDICPGISPIV